MTNLEPYEAPTIRGGDDRYYIHGPGMGFGYSAGTLFPSQRFTNAEDMKAGVLCCNEAYRQGYIRAQADIRAALGMKL